MKLGDLNWRLAPLVAFLYAIGGWNFISLRRIGVPLAVCLFTFLYHNIQKTKYLLAYPVMAVTIFTVMTMPITLMGNSVHDHWFNWMWFWILGLMQAGSLVPMLFFRKNQTPRWIVCLIIHTFVTGFLLTLSNTWGYPTHAWVEAGIGMSFGGCAAWLINEN